MKIELTIPSSIEDSITKISISNVDEGGEEALLTITSSTGREDIYILLRSLKTAVDALYLQKEKT